MTISHIGPYPIEREVGRGGMGVVYLGRDPRLKRAVAIKVLPEAFARDPERLARFEREARLLASLTHPNIAGIYGLEEADGQRFLALEFVEGETLAEHLARGPLPLEETLDVARQIAGALETAHETGIVHRDLKPGNVKLTPSGEVKVLDFGLARGAAVEVGSSPDLSQSPTMTQAATGLGVILGTAAYMSPEQARGKVVDRRTDIWSFGCVLYECLTGARAFEGETVSDMIALILQGEPDWSKLPAKTPERLRALLGRCLEKDARRRLRDIGDARIELEELQGGRVSGAARAAQPAPAAGAPPPAAAAAPRGTSRGLALTVALVAGGAILGALAWNRVASRPAAPPYRFTINAPPGVELLPEPASSAISPDGRMLVYAAADSAGRFSLWLRPLGSYEARPLPNTREADLPFWSPDSRQVGFFAEGKLKRVGLESGASEVICDAPSGRGGAWNRDGVIVFSPAPGGPLLQVRAAGGTPVAVTALDTTLRETAHRWPSFLPDGVHFVYAALPARDGLFQSYVGSLRSMKREPAIAAHGAPVYAEPGYLVFSRGDAVMAQRFNPRSLRPGGDPFALGDGPAPTIMSASPRLSVSNNGVLAWMSAGKFETHLVWLDRGGREIGTVDIPLDRWSATLVSPDGRRAMLTQSSSSGKDDLWIVDLEREIANRLTFGESRTTISAWSADSRHVYFGSNARGPRDIHRKAADGTGPDEVVLASDVPFKDVTDCSPDGKWLMVQQTGGPDGWNLHVMPAAGGELRPFLVTPFDEQGATFSPDGKWIAYQSNESGTGQTYVQSFPVPGHKQQVTKTGSLYSQWSRNTNEIFLLKPDLTIASVAVTPGAELGIGAERGLFRQSSSWTVWSPTPDGQRFLVLRPAVQSAPGISVAVNWQSGREAR